MKFCSRAEACSSSSSSIMLRCGGARVALGAGFPCLCSRCYCVPVLSGFIPWWVWVRVGGGRDLYTTCTCMLIVISSAPLRQPEDGQYRPKLVVFHYIVIKYTSCDTVIFDYILFSKFHTHNGDDSLPSIVDLLRSSFIFSCLLNSSLIICHNRQACSC